MNMTGRDANEASVSIPEYIAEGLEKQDVATLRAIAIWPVLRRFRPG